jgi:asparagine N-glycosylation enzyme membrane subunit Stt3
LKNYPVTLLLFGVALFFYAFAWTGVAAVLGVLGFFFEVLSWIAGAVEGESPSDTSKAEIPKTSVSTKDLSDKE